MEVLEAIRALRDRGEPGALVTPLGDGDPAVLAGLGELLAGPEPPADVGRAVRDVIGAGAPTIVEEGGSEWFVEPLLPAPRLLVFGAIAVADALVPMAAVAGFDVTVIDPRPWLADPARHPGAATVICGSPVEVLDTVSLDPGTAVVSFLHEPRLEDPVLEWALTGRAGYVGAMGSRSTTAAKRERLAARGLAPDRIDRLHAPIGLAVGAVTPEEIAVAVLAEIVAVRRGSS